MPMVPLSQLAEWSVYMELMGDLAKEPFGTEVARELSLVAGLFEAGKLYQRIEIADIMLREYKRYGGDPDTTTAKVSTSFRKWLVGKDSRSEKKQGADTASSVPMAKQSVIPRLTLTPMGYHSPTWRAPSWNLNSGCARVRTKSMHGACRATKRIQVDVGLSRLEWLDLMVSVGDSRTFRKTCRSDRDTSVGSAAGAAWKRGRSSFDFMRGSEFEDFRLKTYPVRNGSRPILMRSLKRFRL